ncbi:MAG: cation transporter [Planctomycetota bacterium]
MSLSCDDCNHTKDLSTAGKGYFRALIIVVVLNLAMGIVEMTGGFFGLSQALKADALDFLGDGFITLLALLAISRAPRWRARAALLQGWFLCILGVSVSVGAIYRAFNQITPEASMMGGLGFAALATNIAAAAVLIPHRHGDANVRAVWLFSRNDAIGNIAVMAAAGLVYLTNSAWPDIITAGIIAGLFLNSAFVILKSARRELQAIS